MTGYGPPLSEWRGRMHEIVKGERPLNWVTSLWGTEIRQKSILTCNVTRIFFWPEHQVAVYFESHDRHFSMFLLAPHIPLPQGELQKLVWFYLQLWSSWLWESRWSWPSSPGLISSGAGQRNTGIFSASHKSPLCTPVAPRSRAWRPGGVRTVPGASAINEVREALTLNCWERGGKGRKEKMQLMKRHGWLRSGRSHPQQWELGRLWQPVSSGRLLRSSPFPRPSLLTCIRTSTCTHVTGVGDA